MSRLSPHRFPGMHFFRLAQLQKLVLDPKPCLGTLGVSLAVLNLSLAWIHTRNADLVAIMALCWIIPAYSLWTRRQSLAIRHEPYSTVAGCLFLAWALYKGWVMVDYDPFLRIQPFLFCLGLGLIAFSAKYLQAYGKELGVMLVLALPEGIWAQWTDQLINISDVAAQSTTALLWYTGFEVKRQGVFVLLPAGGIEVYRGCSGLKAMLELFRLALIFLVMVPTTLLEKLLVPVVAISLAYGVNVIRLGVMTVLAASDYQDAFHYWHEGEGSNVFPVIAMLLFAGFCMFLLHRKEYPQPISHAQVESVDRPPWVIVASVLIGVIVVASGAAWKTLNREGQAFAFPRQVPLPSAQLVQSTSLPGQRRNAYSEILTQHQYQYQARGHRVQIQMSYVTGTMGDLGIFLANYPLNGQRLKTQPNLQIRQQGANFYALYTHRNQAYLSACFDPGGLSTVEEGQFIQNWNSHLYLLGRDYIDDRCLWTHMSIPLNQQSSQQAFSILEENWVSWQKWWHNRVPRLGTQ
ncbi:cyanoexosortase A [Acaryochloris sp. IP29b_bin.137]|uniref:cyanoexosortase A n=1 Tax=Acaryochloris sp. IP29b_bin.137 TaxID=2969217 RepID=UPI0026019735|nr:cyanoexosortase A [Acaryochloris sp. IP29b_bin.137]